VPRHVHQPLSEAELAKKTPQTPLLDSLRQSISVRGPLSVEDYMREVLTHPQHGYYSATVSTLGEAGDFTTAPEAT
jgi:NADH dehydrogenase [ubiquinone] 1 alpha subcomplex assembly factor 7